ncbi:hypothetical protein ACIHEJ_24370 [Streptomyces sp. NPDC052301]|uniref:hypothetical protein n=1 Tax=Streptomyces sp. NPDC052301 TaxID=3365687 RepID=UPI0037D21CC5
MNDTVAVALITAVSTLSAGAVTGGFAFWGTGRQAREQAQQAREERAEQRATRQREVRRDVYVRFLDLAVQVDQHMDFIWIEPGPSITAEKIEQMVELTRQLWKALPAVLLEGPPAVAEAARAFAAAVAEECDTLEEIAGNTGEHPLYVTSGGFTTFTDQRVNTQRRFIETARETLGGHLAPLDPQA